MVKLGQDIRGKLLIATSLKIVYTLVTFAFLLFLPRHGVGGCPNYTSVVKSAHCGAISFRAGSSGSPRTVFYKPFKSITENKRDGKGYSFFVKSLSTFVDTRKRAETAVTGKVFHRFPPMLLQGRLAWLRLSIIRV